MNLGVLIILLTVLLSVLSINLNLKLMYTIDQCSIKIGGTKYVNRITLHYLDCNKTFLMTNVLPMLERLAKVKSLEFIQAKSEYRICFVVTYVEQRSIANIRWHLNADIKSTVNRYNKDNPEHNINLSDYINIFCKGKTTNDHEGEYVVHGDSE